MADQEKPSDKKAATQSQILGASIYLLIAVTTWAISDAINRNFEAPGSMMVFIVTYIFVYGALLVGGLAIVRLSMGMIRMALAPLHQTRELQAQRTIELLQSINEKLSISETARQIIYREQDLKTLHKTIREDIDKGEYDAALALVDTIDETYGFREQAETYRNEIRAARDQSMQRKVDEQFARLDDLIKANRWEDAKRHAGKIERLYGDTARGRTASRYCADARDKFKLQLEREFLESTQRGDTERAMELLNQLDQHLSEEEAAPFQEAARGVFGQKRHNLAFQFKLAILDKEWTTACNVGEEIMSSFPNTKMAKEVNQVIDVLRARAAGAAEAARSESP